MTNERNINQAYEMAKERYASLGVDTEKAMDQLQQIALSLHCWQTDDVMGFENQGGFKGYEAPGDSYNRPCLLHGLSSS